MSCYSVPTRILRTLFGGTALWLGTTFCCPLFAGEIDQAPAAISAAEAPALHAAIPAASIEIEPADHWDTGPTIDEDSVVIDYSYRDDFSQEYYKTFGYDYSYATAEDAYAADFGSQETLPEPADDSCHSDAFCYEDDCNYGDEEACGDEYAYDGYDGNAEQQVDEVAEADVDTEEPAVAEEAFCYEFDDYATYYGYACDDYETYYGYECDEVDAVEQTAEVAEEPADSVEATWEDYYCEDERVFYQDEYLSGMAAAEDTPAVEEEIEQATESVESIVEDAPAEAYEYDYQYDAYEEYEYDYEMVGSEQYDESESLVESAEVTPVEMDLFAWRPIELLNEADTGLLRSIESLYRESSSDRREALNGYIELLGFDAIDFAYRYERDAEADILALSEDLPGAAAFLACYRLIEGGQINKEEAVDLFEQSLSGLTLDWIDSVADLTVEPQLEPTQPHPVVQAMVSATNHSIGGVSAIWTTASERLAEIPWNELQGRIETIQSASRPSSSDDTATF